MEFTGKKVLILGGGSVHSKVVTAAKEMGVYTIVADYYLEDKAPAKRIADESLLISVKDVDMIVDYCKKEHIDGVINFCNDPAQIPYQKICSKLGLPCYGTEEQFEYFTNKTLFKKLCKSCGVGTINEYSLKDVNEKRVTFPVFVKPDDSRGSRGQAVCYNYQDLNNAIEIAKQESNSGKIIIEDYIVGSQEMQITYFFVDGTPYLIRTTDSYNGSEKFGLEKVVACSVSPSRYTNEYLEKGNKNVLKMFKKIGIKNGPVFMQGFYHKGDFLFFDPGRRFPGVDYELVYKTIYNIDFMKMMVCYAICGSFGKQSLENDMVKIKDKRAAVLFPTIAAGKIDSIYGLHSLKNSSFVFGFSQRYNVGDKVGWSFDVNQRFGEIDFVADNTQLLKTNINKAINEIKILNEKGDNMVYAPFDVERII